MTSPSATSDIAYLPYDDKSQPPRWIDDYPRSKLRTPLGPFVARPLTLSERTGPLHLERKLQLGPADMAYPHPDKGMALGQYVYITGTVYDDDRQPIPGALLELWQANTSGKYIHEYDTNDAPVDPNFEGAMRLVTNAEGKFTVRTIKPGAYPVTISTWEWRAPHIHVSIFGRSWMTRLITQLFFPGDPLLKQDLLLNSIPDPAARERLIVRPLPTVVTQTAKNILGFEHEFVIRGKASTPTVIDHDEASATTSGPFAHMTTGPFFPPQFMDASLSDLTTIAGARATGTRILLTGRVLEENLNPTINSIVEIWQPDSHGIFAHPLDPRHAQADAGFSGWGRANTDKQGWYRFTTILPGSYPDDSGAPRIPHINALVLASGILRPLLTTAFLPTPGGATADPVLDRVTDPERRARLIAVRDPSLDSDGLEAYRFDIVLRGERETPFFLD